MKKIYLLIIPAFMLAACSQKNKQLNMLAPAFIDSIKTHSDSTYTKEYYRTDFVTATYYLNTKDSTLSQVMKDSAGIIRQVVITKKNTRIFFGSYYPNGQLQASLPLDNFGQYHGTGRFFYEDGKLQSTGNYTHGFKTGAWNVYDREGKVTATDNFNSNGQLVQPGHP